MPRLLLVNTRLESTGGIETYACGVAAAFVAMGWEVTALNVRDSWRGERDGFRWHGLMPKGALFYRVAVRFKNWLTRRWLKRHLDQYNLVLCSHRVVAPSVNTVCLSQRIPYVVVLHGLEVWQDLPMEEQEALEAASALVHVSEFTKDEVIRRYPRLAEAPFYKISPCVDPEVFSMDGPIERDDNVYQLLTVGRLDGEERDKGHRLVMRAMALLKEKGIDQLRYKIVGDGPDRPALEACCAELGLDEVVAFTGRVSHEAKIRAYHECDLFLLVAPLQRLSQGRLSGEGFGIVYLEAGACAKPVIGGHEGGAVDPVRDGENGYRCPPDENELAARIEKLLRDENLGRQMGNRGRNIVDNEYTSIMFQSNWEALARTLVS